MNFYKKATQILTNRMQANGGTIRIHRLSDAEKFIWRMEQEGKVEFVERHSDDSTTYRLKPAQTP